MWKLTIAAFVGVMAAQVAAPTLAAPQVQCAMGAADARWISQALTHWRFAERHYLKLPPAPWPVVVTFDDHCSYMARAWDGDAPRWSSAPHGPKVTLPDGNAAPIGPTSFAIGDPAGRPDVGYFVMSLPSVWRAGGVKSGLGLETLMDGVILHELTHTRQAYFATPLMAELTRRYGLSDEVNDDTIQETYQSNPAYVADYQAERDLLFRAAAAPTDAKARKLAEEAFRRLRSRRARWFTGADAKWVSIDDLFLTMEGLGQWVAWAWFTDPAGGGLGPAATLPELRRGGKRWTQDEGLALFLVVDRLLPDWQRLAFAAKPLLAEALLQRAIESNAASDPRKRAPEAHLDPVPVRQKAPK